MGFVLCDFLFDLQERLIYRSFFEDHHAQDLCDFVGRLTQSVAMLQPMNQHIHHHRNPQLRLDGIGRVPKNVLMCRCCFIHLNSSSIFQRLRYKSAIDSASSER